jgi:hypothetical protein
MDLPPKSDDEILNQLKLLPTYDFNQCAGKLQFEINKAKNILKEVENIISFPYRTGTMLISNQSIATSVILTLKQNITQKEEHVKLLKKYLSTI